jgi:hydroxymethylpyrimidine/phosphomethylpyrimidine kinase
VSVVLCVGGLDPAGRAGLLADVRAVEGNGGRAIAIAAALTYQSSRSVDGFCAVSPDVLAAQLAPVLRDEPIASIKLGQLGSAGNVALLVRALPPLPLVVDTPLVSSSGALLFESSMVSDAYGPLLARATLVTPNAPEAFALAGRAASDERAACERVARSLAGRVLLKGGHLSGEAGRVTDVLLAGDEQERTVFEGPRLPGRFRGTGCRLASAIATRLARGEALVPAIAGARAWLQERLREELR